MLGKSGTICSHPTKKMMLRLRLHILSTANAVEPADDVFLKRRLAASQ